MTVPSLRRCLALLLALSPACPAVAGDVVRCGPGRDRTLVDRGDRVSRDCESVRR